MYVCTCVCVCMHKHACKHMCECVCCTVYSKHKTKVKDVNQSYIEICHFRVYV